MFRHDNVLGRAVWTDVTFVILLWIEDMFDRYWRLTTQCLKYGRHIIGHWCIEDGLTGLAGSINTLRSGRTIRIRSALNYTKKLESIFQPHFSKLNLITYFNSLGSFDYLLFVFLQRVLACLWTAPEEWILKYPWSSTPISKNKRIKHPFGNVELLISFSLKW